MARRSSRKQERYEVLYEEIKSMFKTVSGGHSMLDRKIESVLRETREIREELGHVEKAVSESRQILDTLVNRFEAHEHAHTR